MKEDDKAGDQEEAPCSREATADDLGCSETERFEMELEFVQVRLPKAPIALRFQTWAKQCG